MKLTRRSLAVLSLVAILSALPYAQDAPPKEAGTFRQPDLVELVALDSSIRLDIRYATKNNFTGRAVYKEARAFLQRPAAEALSRVHHALKRQGYGIVVFDGYRPWKVTKTFWDITPVEKREFVADPAKGSRHNRGCAVDLTMYDLATGLIVQMPGEYDEMSKRSYPDYAGGPPEARARRDLLRTVMERHGFTVEPNEWWHFNFKDWQSYPILDISFQQASKK